MSAANNRAPTTPAFDPANDIEFGRKEGKFARTSLGGAGGGDPIKLCIGSVAKPLRAPFGISDPFAGDAASPRRRLRVMPSVHHSGSRETRTSRHAPRSTASKGRSVTL